MHTNTCKNNKFTFYKNGARSVIVKCEFINITTYLSRKRSANSFILENFCCHIPTTTTRNLVVVLDSKS